LAISRQIADVLGGRHEVKSEIGRGSTFTVTIDAGTLEGVRLLDVPVADLVHRPSMDVRGSQQPLSAAKILLVEDGVTNRKLISLILERAGAQVVTAENGQVGLDIASRQQFDLILMDMQMPVLDGYSATTELRRRGVEVPVIALTAHAMKGDEERCRAAGCSGYLTKPIETNHLLNAVVGVLRGQDSPPRTGPAAKLEEALVSTLPMDDLEFREVVEEFVEHLREKVAQMHAASNASDYGELARLAHWLKGAGGTAGFDAFTQPAGALERGAKAGKAATIGPLLDEIQRLCDRIVLAPLELVDAR
jgi:CheY-like chemotaxis protein/HPt (histidine-containing phosphotransfer) domain-containing protein